MSRNHIVSRSGAAAAMLVALFAAMGPAQAQQEGLVIGGETIADAATLAAAKKEGQLIAFTTIPSLPLKTVFAAFTKDTGISVETVRLTTERMFQRVVSEAAANRLEADLVDLTDGPLVQELVERGILNRPHRVPNFDKIDPRLKDPQGRWYGLMRPISVITVNTAVMKEADYPKSWKDVLDPKWSGRISLPSIDAGGSAFTMYAFLRDEIAPDYWTKLGALKPRVFPGIAAAATDLVRGESSILIGGAAQVLPQITAKAPVRIIFPTEGVSSFFHGGGITTTTKRPNAAAIFLNWMTSQAGARVIGSIGAYGALADAPPPEAAGLTFPAQNKVWNIDTKRWSELRQKYMSEWRAQVSK